MFVLRRIWAAPNSLIGLMCGLASLAAGGHVHVFDGVVEFTGGGLGRLVERHPRVIPYSAITFGHVILAVSEDALASLRSHEYVHVRQYERWGLLFLPVYLGSSLMQLVRGRDPYLANRFEKQARDDHDSA